MHKHLRRVPVEAIDRFMVACWCNGNIGKEENIGVYVLTALGVVEAKPGDWIEDLGMIAGTRTFHVIAAGSTRADQLERVSRS